MSRRKASWLGVGALAIVLSLVVAIAWAVRSPGVRAGSQPGGGRTAPLYDLAVSLHKVEGKGPKGAVHGPRLDKSAAAVQAVMTQLYSIGFVDPALWAGGRFPSLTDVFAPEAKEEARAQLGDLTLGEAAGELEAVRPESAKLDVRFLLNGARHPVTAFASMDFAGMGLAGKASIPIQQEGTYVLRKTEAGWRIASYRVQSHVPSTSLIEEKIRQAAYSPGLQSRAKLFVLVIGSDARPGQPMAATRADSIHIIGVNPGHGVVSILGIPRDSYVSIPGAGTGKINGALVYGGPELMVRTVEHLTGIHLDAYVLTGFLGFRHMIGAIGGVHVTIPYRMNDTFSGAHFRKGPAKLSGTRALAFARDRHDVPGGDFGRSMNQGRLILATMREFRADLHRDPLTLLRWGVAAARSMKTDLGLSQMIELLMAVPSFDPSRVRVDVVSGSGAMVGGSSVVRLGAAAQARFRDLRRDAMLRR